MNYQNFAGYSLSNIKTRLISLNGKVIHGKTMETKGVPEAFVRKCSSI